MNNIIDTDIIKKCFEGLSIDTFDPITRNTGFETDKKNWDYVFISIVVNGVDENLMIFVDLIKTGLT